MSEEEKIVSLSGARNKAKSKEEKKEKTEKQEIVYCSF